MDDTIARRFGELLHRLRRQRGLTQKAVAAAAQVPPGLVSQIEAGKRPQVSLAVAVHLLVALDVARLELWTLFETDDEARVQGVEGRADPGRPTPQPSQGTPPLRSAQQRLQEAVQNLTAVQAKEKHRRLEGWQTRALMQAQETASVLDTIKAERRTHDEQRADEQRLVNESRYRQAREDAEKKAKEAERIQAESRIWDAQREQERRLEVAGRSIQAQRNADRQATADEALQADGHRQLLARYAPQETADPDTPRHA